MPDTLIICPTTDRMDARLRDGFDPIFLRDLDDPVAWLAAHGAGIHYVLTDGHLGVPADILVALPALALISSYGVGYDAIDTGAATERGIPVTHTPGVLDAEVATSALLLCLTCWRGFEGAMEHARSGRWTNGSYRLTRSADNRRVGILGLGRIGKAFVRKLAPFDADILYHGRSKQDVPHRYYTALTDMARDCDTLVSFAPGGAATHHLINAEVMAALGPDGTLINVGRGSVVDEGALITALQTGTLGAAGLDVFEHEPHIPDALRALPNAVLSPHVGSATVETRRAMGDLAIDNLVAARDGAPLLTPVPESAALL
ncbi:MAG: 2-hydroxyacid dehydrogenase [Pseudomonadota bacterium]